MSAGTLMQENERLREEVARLRAAPPLPGDPALLDDITDGYFILDDARRVVAASAKACAMWRLGQEQVVGQVLTELFPHIAGSADWDGYETVAATGRRIRVEKFSASMGQWVDVCICPYPPGGTITYIRDISRHRLAEAARRDADERLQLALEAGAVAGSWVWEMPGSRIRTDARLARLFGIPVEDAATGISLQSFAERILEEDRDGIRRAVAAAVRGDGGFRAEFRLAPPTLDAARGPGAGRAWFEASGRIAFAPDGRPLRFPGVLVDISHRKRAEQDREALLVEMERRVAERTSALATSEARQRILFESLPELLFLTRVTADGTLIYETVNPALGRMFGRAPEALRGARLETVLDASVIETVRPHYAMALAQGRVAYEVTVPSPDGPRLLETVLICLPPEQDELSADGTRTRFVLGSARDVTDRRALEEQLRQSQKMEAIGQLTGGIAHDFNNLLTGIIGALELIQLRVQQRSFAALPTYVEPAIQSAMRAAALTHRLLAYARRQTLAPRPTDINALVGTMMELIGRTMGPQIVVDTDPHPAPPVVLCDPHQLENALLNLAINARDAMEGGGRLSIATGLVQLPSADARLSISERLPPGRYGSLTIADTGCGMPADVLARAFDPFFTTKPQGRGTGLGLSMTYGFVRQSGGAIDVASTPGQGTSVTLILPLAPLAPEQAGEAPGRIESGGAPRLRILVVDDEATVRDLIAELLHEQGHEAVTAADGLAALAALEGARFDLMITDIGLPGGMDGRQLALASRLRRPELKILVVTGYAEGVMPAGMQVGSDFQLLTKPFTFGELREALCRLVS